MDNEKQKANKKQKVSVRVVKAAPAPVAKAETSAQVDKDSTFLSGKWLTPPFDMIGLANSVSHSSILPQCIRAYKNNIAGFGIGVRYKTGYDDNDLAAKAEFEKAEQIIECLNMEMDTKAVFEHAIEARECFGISYIEVIRKVLTKEVARIEFIRDTETIQKTVPLEPMMPVNQIHNGHIHQQHKRFRIYRQQVNGKTVYYKEFGDPRMMSRTTGEYVKDGETIPVYEQANELVELSIGVKPYGEVRWVGQILGVDGSRKAEKLNNRYFDEGRHTPLLIMVKGGTLTDESFENLQTYMNGIKGENGQHAFMLLETESADNKTDYDGSAKPDIDVVPLASILQQDELFQGYLDNNRKRVQSSFQLPDLYVGYTTDFNRATAQTAQEVTEKQVFQPERRSLAWIVNNKLLADYGFQYVEAYFKEPDISNPDDLMKILNITERAGGLTPNKAKELTHKIMGETAEDYDGEWADIPLVYSRSQSSQSMFSDAMMSQFNKMMSQFNKQIEKAQGANDDAVVAVMKEVRNLIKDKAI